MIQQRSEKQARMFTSLNRLQRFINYVILRNIEQDTNLEHVLFCAIPEYSN